MSNIQNDGLPPDFGFWLAITVVGIVIVTAFARWLMERQQERSRARNLKRSTERIAAQAREAFVQVLLARGYTTICPDDVIVQRGVDGELCCKAVVSQDNAKVVLCGDYYAGLGLYFERRLHIL